MKPTQPVGAFNDATGLWSLLLPWRCPIGRGRTLCIAPGFESDGASIPRVLWSAVGPRYAADTFPAALAHDALYASELVPRDEADAIFRDHLREMGVSRIKRNAYYAAVRLAGWAVWNRHSEQSVYDARRFIAIGRCHAQ
jgi:hypothetical protein